MEWINIVTQTVYITVSVGMTVWVGQSLHKHGRGFLLHAFKEDETLADSINHLLLVGFYLVNLGWVLLWTQYFFKPDTVNEAIDYVTTKVGVVMLILGAVHFINLRVFWTIRKVNIKENNIPPIPYTGMSPEND